MGKAITYKRTRRAENDVTRYGASSMQGCRDEMEATWAPHVHLLDYAPTLFFGVYDGHGGAEVASYCSRKFHEELKKDPSYVLNLPGALKNVYSSIDEKLQESDEWRRDLAYSPHIRNLIRWLWTDVCGANWLPKAPYLPPLQEGSTACVAVIRGNRIYVANVGDSRCVLSRNGQAIDLSMDHKPNYRHERKRIEKAGGQVRMDDIPKKVMADMKLGIHRIEGILHISRSIGDFQFKQDPTLSRQDQMVTCCPDICDVPITNDTQFFVIASAGVWDVMTSRQVVNFVHQCLQSEEKDPGTICEKLLDSCLREGSKENLTIILVQFKATAHGGAEANVAHGGAEANGAHGGAEANVAHGGADRETATDDIESKGSGSHSPKPLEIEAQESGSKKESAPRMLQLGLAKARGMLGVPTV
ncbi:hypothetical protein CFC21_111633 [Triticum aestivum]|uniref:protein-serine/threonine phosphatase n=2 Tax=Triticum aestivum TaxID=4565 RepID=A0A3B6TMC8_WHEAT|nr:hypothetical protein CFC21_111633 [Triticum aestivum]